MEENLVEGTKVCKQCGRTFHKSKFRKYSSRKAEGSTRRTRVAENTVCLGCESFNLAATRLFKLETKTPAQEEKLEQIAEVYRTLHKAGLHPIGAYAKHVLGLETGRRSVSNSTNVIDEYIAFARGMTSNADTGLIDELKMWLTKELTAEPDYYLNHVYSRLHVACRCDYLTEEQAIEADRKGMKFEVKSNYKDLLGAVLDRFYAYEDNYDWDKEDE